jgi:hypothetical protein
MHFAEGHQQPEFFGTIPHSIYWAIVTITSGYGIISTVISDRHPAICNMNLLR